MQKENPWGHCQLMVTAAHRYCLGRRTYIVSACVDWLLYNWDSFDTNTKDLILEETRECLDKGNGGDACDIDSWNLLLKETSKL